MLIHKMDLVSEENRETVFRNRTEVISDVSGGVDPTFFMTSIWDETLYKVLDNMNCEPRLVGSKDVFLVSLSACLSCFLGRAEPLSQGSTDFL